MSDFTVGTMTMKAAVTVDATGKIVSVHSSSVEAQSPLSDAIKAGSRVKFCDPADREDFESASEHKVGTVVRVRRFGCEIVVYPEGRVFRRVSHLVRPIGPLEYTRSKFAVGDYAVLVRTGVLNDRNAVGSVAARRWDAAKAAHVGKVYRITEIGFLDGDVVMLDAPYRVCSPDYLRKATTEEIEKYVADPLSKLPPSDVPEGDEPQAPFAVGDDVVCNVAHEGEGRCPGWTAAMSQLLGCAGKIVDIYTDGDCEVRFESGQYSYKQSWLKPISPTQADAWRVLAGAVDQAKKAGAGRFDIQRAVRRWSVLPTWQESPEARQLVAAVGALEESGVAPSRVRSMVESALGKRRKPDSE